MKKIMLMVCTAAVALSLSAGAAAAAPTQATNYWAIDATCDGLGAVVIEVVNRGNWGAGKFQGTQLTGIPRWFTSTVTHEEFGVVFADGNAKRPADVDDICRYSFVDGPYLIAVEVGVKVVGR
jgi:hypothetical protein